MKINRFFALSAIALIVIAAMGAITMKVIALSNHSSVQETESCDNQAGDSAEVEDSINADDGQECNDQNQRENEAAAPDPVDDVVAGNPTITADAAQKIAESFLNAGSANKVELDQSDQDGKLIYSVEIGNTDVSVDAMSGKVLGTEPADQ